MKKEDYQFFQEHGYVSLGKILTDEELDHFVGVYNRDWMEKKDFWFPYSNHQTINCDALASSSEFDGIIRHPKIISPLQTLMGGDICFSEICIRHMAPYDGEPRRSWHRDRKHWLEHPLRMDYIQLMLYLSDVNETTHCFSISPESIHQAPLDTEPQLERGGVHDLHGEAGTAILFNVAVLHTATVRVTQHERKTVQVYYGHRHHQFLSNDSLIPVDFWHNHSDPETRAFYGVLNDKTRRYIELAGMEKRPLGEMAEILYEIDYKNRGK